METDEIDIILQSFEEWERKNPRPRPVIKATTKNITQAFLKRQFPKSNKFTITILNKYLATGGKPFKKDIQNFNYDKKIKAFQTLLLKKTQTLDEAYK